LKKLALLATTVAVGGLAIHTSNAADHLDSPTLATNPMADILDVYAWNTADGKSVNLAMTVSPGDDGKGAMGGPLYGSTRHFGPSVIYVFHVTSVAMFGATSGSQTDVTCRFATDRDAECWVGSSDYVHGDPSMTTGWQSLSGRIRFFAGLRSDPFFFNLQGFRDAVATVDAVAASLNFDFAGCPLIDDATGAALRSKLQEAAQATAAAPCATDSADCFAHLNAKVILVQVDKTLLNSGSNNILGVWASTHAAVQ